MSAWIGLGVFAVLFAIFGLVRQRQCGGDCGRCADDCELHNMKRHS
jgi:hypothetical protein